MPELTLVDVEVGLLRPNPSNPNVMSEREFNALCESIEEEGFIDPIQAVLCDDGMYEIVGGEHRWEAAKILGMPTVPVTPLDPEKFDQDRRDWNLVKMNIVHGGLDPAKFAALYDRMKDKYDAEVLQALMGFTDAEAFRRVYKDVRDALPPELQKALDEAGDEIRTIDDLSIVLNRLFHEFGDTLPSNMMVFSWAGKDVMWIRCSNDAWKVAKTMVADAAEMGETVDDLFARRMSAAKEAE